MAGLLARAHADLAQLPQCAVRYRRPILLVLDETLPLICSLSNLSCKNTQLVAHVEWISLVSVNSQNSTRFSQHQ